MIFNAFMSSGCYQITADDAESAAWLALSLSKDKSDYLIDVEPINYGKEILPQQLGSHRISTC